MSNKNYIILFTVILLNFWAISEVLSTGNKPQSEQTEIPNIFVKFENGMSTGAVKDFSIFFDVDKAS